MAYGDVLLMKLFKKYVMKGFGWKTCVLDEKEIEGVMKEHREQCKKIWQECLEDAKEMNGDNLILAEKIASTLFEKRALASYTILSAKLDEKVEKLQNPEIKKDDKEVEKLKEEKINFDEESAEEYVVSHE